MAPKHRPRNGQLMTNKKGSPKAASLCAGRASSVSGSYDRRARGREDRVNTQPLRGRGMTEPQLRRRAAARRWATSWLAPGGQASPRQPPQRRPSLEERGETSTRFRSTTVEKGPAPDAARRGASRHVLRSCYNAAAMCDNTPRSHAVNYLTSRKNLKGIGASKKGGPRAAPGRQIR
jgi:hypothetical protein